MNAVDVIRRLRSHQLWTNRRLLDVCRPLSAEQLNRPFEIGQGTLMKTIVHIYAPEFVWCEAIFGNPTPVSPFDIHFDSLAELEVAWKSLDERWDQFYAALTEADLDRPITKRSTSSGFNQMWALPLYDVLLHMFTHAQYTAAQLKNMLRHLGVSDLPDVMLITQSRESTA